MKDVLMEIRIPFCHKSCDFCRERVFEGRNAPQLNQYMTALLREIHANAENFSDCRIAALRFDGGTASLVDASDLELVMRMIRREYKLWEDAPLTLLASINDISGASMTFFNRIGITRFDFEVMSLEPLDFRNLPLQDPNDWLPVVSTSFLRAKERRNMGLVLLYGKKAIPTQNLRRSAIAAGRSNAVHIFLRRCLDTDAIEDQALLEAQCDEVRDVLQQAGFHEYLPLHFAREGAEDRFFKEEAAGMERIGFGLGAKTRLDGAEARNTMDLEKYIAYAHDFTKITEEARAIS